MQTTRLTLSSTALAAIGFAVGLSLFAGQTAAMKNLDGHALRALVAGNTFSGQMFDGTPYRVFYDTSGTARAKTVRGNWAIKGEQLCATFADDEQICLAGSLKDGEILWLSPHGELEGTGKILKGNPFKY